MLLFGGGSVRESGEQHFITVGINIVECLLLMLGERVEGEVQKYGEN